MIIILFLSQNIMLWILKRTISMRKFFFPGGQNISNLISSTVVNAFSKFKLLHFSHRGSELCKPADEVLVVTSLVTSLDSNEPAPHCSLIRAFTASSHKVPLIHIPPIFCPEIKWFSVPSIADRPGVRIIAITVYDL